MKAENTFSLLQAKEDQEVASKLSEVGYKHGTDASPQLSKEPILKYLGGLLASRAARQYYCCLGLPSVLFGYGSYNKLIQYLKKTGI